jgi:hypothetical protein
VSSHGCARAAGGRQQRPMHARTHARTHTRTHTHPHTRTTPSHGLCVRHTGAPRTAAVVPHTSCRDHRLASLPGWRERKELSRQIRYRLLQMRQAQRRQQRTSGGAGRERACCLLVPAARVRGPGTERVPMAAALQHSALRLTRAVCAVRCAHPGRTQTCCARRRARVASCSCRSPAPPRKCGPACSRQLATGGVCAPGARQGAWALAS